MKYSVSIDVPDLAAGIDFYTSTFGLVETARPLPVYALIGGNGMQTIGIIEKPEGSVPAPGTQDRRHYGRHWTPIHLDFQVDDFEETLHRLVEAGGTIEQRFDMDDRPPLAFCADPFGNGLCVLRTRG